MAKVLWTQKQDIGPRPRAAHAMVYDAARQRVVLFGGDSLANALFADTWEWDGETWTQVQDIGPSARAFHAMAYDSARGRTVLFGGRAPAGLSGDTWEWDGENWTQVADTGPVKRSGHAMAFDSQRQRVLLFGGESGSRLDDTWEWDGNEWVQQDDTGPSPRAFAAMAYDSARRRMVLFGGAAADPGLGDTWERDATGWSQKSDFGPDPCAGAAMVFRGGRVALFGGIGSVGAFPINPPGPPVFSRTWEWDGHHWTARQDMGPGPRVFHAMAFDEERKGVILFGGSPVALNDPVAPPSLSGDTWEATGGADPGGAGEGTGGVNIASVNVAPDPVLQGNMVLITVTLASAAPNPAKVPIFIDNDSIFMGNNPLSPVAEVPIAVGGMSGSVSLLIPPNIVSGFTPVHLIARLGISGASTSLTILP